MRSTLDKLLSTIGLVLAAVLAVAAGLLFWASSFIGNEVKTQLTDQHITMPTAQTGLTALPQADQDALKEYAGSALDTGPEARAYADHYIKVHMDESSQGKTYSEISGQFMKQCTGDNAAQAQSADCQKLGGLRQSLFMGDTLRGLLLYGFAFATIGTIAMYAAWAALLGAFIFLVLGLLGLNHARKVHATTVPRETATATV